MGRQYGISRVYIFEFSEDRKSFGNTFEWCEDGFASQQHNLQNMPCWWFEKNLEFFNEKGFFAPPISEVFRPDIRISWIFRGFCQ